MKLLLGKPVVEKINEDLKNRAKVLKLGGTDPCLAILRVGEDKDKIAYENSAAKRAEQIGIKTRHITLPGDAEQEELEEAIEKVNGDDSIHGLLILLPLPKKFDAHSAIEKLDPAKDIDGITLGSMAGVYAGRCVGYPPCTAEACVEILKHYGTEIQGKKVTVLGRSLVVGKPLAMMLLKENGTVTLCHSKTKDIEKIASSADILIAAMGRAKAVDSRYIKAGQTVMDVGINFDDDGKLCGDVDFEEVKETVGAITPVPGGVGGVTTNLLMKHVIESAEKAAKR